MALEEPCSDRQGIMNSAIARGGAFPKLTRLSGMQGDLWGIFYSVFSGGDSPTLLPLKNTFHG